MNSEAPLTIPTPKALVFDLMGTCLDWQSSVVFGIACHCPGAFSNNTANNAASNANGTKQDPDEFAMQWRTGFFEEIQSRFEQGQPEEDIDVTHRRILDRLLREWNIENKVDETARTALVDAWHNQMAWEDVGEALEGLKREFFLVVLANGSTRLQLDLMQSSGLPFHTLLSSELLQLTKPDPKIYQKAMSLMKLRPEECLMIAAHAYDLRAAKQVGMSTAYIQRKTEDPHEDMNKVKSEVDIFVPLDETARSDQHGLSFLGNKLLDSKWAS